LNPKSPLEFWLLAGASSVALAAVVVSLSTRTVQADVRLPRPAQTPTTAPLVVPAAPTQPLKTPRAQWKSKMHGLASWYGGVFNGRKTASGELFDMYAMTACHPTLPFGSLVKVVNRTNKRSVVVRITDRGDLVDEGRVIDLSYAAAQQLAMTESGLAKVDLEILSLGSAKPAK
jgi:rare lipoprotein A